LLPLILRMQKIVSPMSSSTPKVVWLLLRTIHERLFSDSVNLNRPCTHREWYYFSSWIKYLNLWYPCDEISTNIMFWTLSIVLYLSKNAVLFIFQNTTFRRLDYVSVIKYNLLSWAPSIELVRTSGHLC
jgi:hypothetical protein